VRTPGGKKEEKAYDKTGKNHKRLLSIQQKKRDLAPSERRGEGPTVGQKICLQSELRKGRRDCARCGGKGSMEKTCKEGVRQSANSAQGMRRQRN